MTLLTRMGAFALAAVGAICISDRTLAQAQGWTQTFADEFNGTSLNSANWWTWQPSTPGPFNNERQEYLPQQVAVNGGNLVITAVNQPYNSQYGNYSYRSGRVEGNFSQHYGRFEIRADLPGTKGTWPALWLLPNSNWPTQGEIDILENEGLEPNITSSAFHFQLNGNHQYVTARRSAARFGVPENYHNSFHTYAVEWDASQIRYYVDDVHWYTTYNSGNYAGEGGTTVQGFLGTQTAPMHVIFNLAVGGDFLGGDQPDGSSVWPQQLLVDYVRIYQRNNDPLKLRNGQFEENSGSLAGWTVFGNRVETNNVSVHDEAANGLAALKLFGQFTGSNNASGVSQGITVSPGDEVRASIDRFIRSQDTIIGTNNTATLKIEFFNEWGGRSGTSAMLQQSAINIANGGSTQNAWENFNLSAVAPANAVEARLSLIFNQIGNAGGAVHLDNVRFTNVNLAAGADFNLDGSVDDVDLGIWQTNYGLEESGARETGDANGDGNVDGSDLLEWQQQHTTAAATVAAAAVPEPSAALTACTAALAILRATREAR